MSETVTVGKVFKYLNPNLIQIIVKYSVPAINKTPHFFITKISWLMLLREIIALYIENHMKPINILCGQNKK
jgi:hypothetical protein